MNNTGFEKEMIAAGFKKLDRIESKPPKIKWGVIYQDWSDKQKITYLEKFASSMNHAASLIQGERDQLTELLVKKDEQLTKMSEAVAANNAMLQQEVTRMNAQRQGYHKEVARLNAQIRELNGG